MGRAAAGDDCVAWLRRKADAQSPLRWKFKRGEKFDYHMVEEMTLTTRGVPLDETSTPLHQEMDMTWTVVGVNDDGEAVIEQKFHDVQAENDRSAGRED